MKKAKNRNINRKRVIIMIVGIVIIGFLVWLAIRMITMRTDLEVNVTYKLPEFGNLDNLAQPEPSSYAVAIDGETIKSSDDIPTSPDTHETQTEESDISNNVATEIIARPTASTAKMILGLAIMNEKPFSSKDESEIITVTQEMYDRYVWYANNNGSTTKVEVGEQISVYDALVSVFLASSNNMADSLAIWAFGSLDAYREYAGRMLASWGIMNTVIGTDASGFDPSTTSTPSDLARIGYKVLENEILKEIVGTKEYEVPVAGLITNTNKILGMNRVIGIKTGYIGDVSGYCLISGYTEGEHIVTLSLLGAPTRAQSFNDSLKIIAEIQNDIKEQAIIKAGQVVGYYNSWWTGIIEIKADEDLRVVGWNGATKNVEIKMSGESVNKGSLVITIGGREYVIAVSTDEFAEKPNFGERFLHSFGWQKNTGEIPESEEAVQPTENEEIVAEQITENPVSAPQNNNSTSSTPSGNCTIKYGNLMLINPNFTVDTNFIDARKKDLVSMSSLYGIVEGNPYNGDNLLDAEAGQHLNEMVKAYETAYPGHTFETRSCYRARGTTCGRLCAATGTSDHHTGLTCDLLDPTYGTSLDTDTYDQHIDWQWLRANSYKYGFIDRFPAEWAGGSMNEPLNVDENGSTGLFETWHYRYVGVGPATEIATGKYNNGRYDSLEHYLKARGMVVDLKLGKCE